MTTYKAFTQSSDVTLHRTTRLALALGAALVALTSAACQVATEEETGDSNAAMSFFGSSCDDGWQTCSGGTWRGGKMNPEEGLNAGALGCAGLKRDTPGTQTQGGTNGQRLKYVECRRKEPPVCRAKSWETCSGGKWVKGLPASEAKKGKCEIESRGVDEGDQIATATDGTRLFLYIPGTCE